MNDNSLEFCWNIQTLYSKAKNLVLNFLYFTFSWVRREANSVAYGSPSSPRLITSHFSCNMTLFLPWLKRHGYEIPFMLIWFVNEKFRI